MSSMRNMCNNMFLVASLFLVAMPLLLVASLFLPFPLETPKFEQTSWTAWHLPREIGLTPLLHVQLTRVYVVYQPSSDGLQPTSDGLQLTRVYVVYLNYFRNNVRY